MSNQQAGRDAVTRLLRSQHANAQEASVQMMMHVNTETRAGVRLAARRRMAVAKPTANTDPVAVQLDRMVQFEIADARHNDPRGRD